MANSFRTFLESNFAWNVIKLFKPDFRCLQHSSARALVHRISIAKKQFFEKCFRTCSFKTVLSFRRCATSTWCLLDDLQTNNKSWKNPFFSGTTLPRELTRWRRAVLYRRQAMVRRVKTFRLNCKNKEITRSTGLIQRFYKKIKSD